MHLFDDDYCLQKSHYDQTLFDKESELCAGVPDWNKDGLIDGGKDACQVRPIFFIDGFYFKKYF